MDWGTHADAQGAGEFALEQRQLLLERLLFQQHPFGILAHQLARLGQGDKLAGAYHQIGADTLFQRGNAGREGGLGDVACFGRFGKMPVFGQLVKVVKLLDVHLVVVEAVEPAIEELIN